MDKKSGNKSYGIINTMLARKNIAANERCIVALDYPDFASAMDLVSALDGLANFYKVGLELFAGGHGKPLLDELIKRNNRVFVDLKLFDVPETVKRATAQIADSGADFLTVHGNNAIMEAAASAKGSHLKILAVTVLTSLDQNDITEMGWAGDIPQLVLSRAKKAIDLGCDGVVSSGGEVAILRRECGHALTLVTPGIRPASTTTTDDQKRTANPASVIADGGDYLVVGRPIKNASNRREAFTAIIREIEEELKS